MTQFQFNIMDAVGYGYYRVWLEREYALRLALFPFLIKFACIVGVYILDLEENILRQGLVMLPAYLAEGWMLAQFLRTLLMNERWPMFIPDTLDQTVIMRLMPRARGIIAATLVYTLLELLSNVMRFLAFGNLTHDDMERLGKTASEPQSDAAADVAAQAAQAPMDFMMFIPSVLLLLGLIWAFRLMWIYIPFAVLMPPKSYLKAVSGFMASVKMIAVFFCVVVPVLFVVMLVNRLLQGVFVGADPTVSDFFGMFIMSFFDIVLALVVTTSMTWAMRGVLPKAPDALKLRSDDAQPK